jgi:oligopeptidase B
MGDHGDPELVAHLRAENAHTGGWFAAHDELVTSIYEEIRSRIQETDLSTPVEHGGWWYVTRTEQGLAYPIHHRGPGREHATAQVVLDENVEARGHDHFDLGALDLSIDHRLAAWSADTAGDERYTLRIRDLATGEDLPDVVTDVANAGTAWSRDGAWLFYVRPDDQERPCEVWRHRLGTDPADDVLVLREHDERFHLAIGTTRSDEWIVVHAASKTTTEVHLVATAAPLDPPVPVMERREGIEYQVDHWGDRLVMVTNDDALDFRILVADVATVIGRTHDDDGPRHRASPATWSELVPHEPDRRIVDVAAFAGHLVIEEWSAAQPRLRLLFRDGGGRTVEVDTEPHDVDLSANPAWDTDLVRYATQSLTGPPTLWEEHVRTGERSLLRRVPTPNVDLDAYVGRRLWATAPDGTDVPVDVVHRRGTPLDGTAPGVLYGYGAYEVSLPPWFSVARLSLLDRGWVWALAHPRGGGELGRRWYLDGKLLHKQHTFDDTLACADHLAAEGIVDGSRLAVRGGSAGGLLAAACAVQNPERFAAVVAEVPFVDLVTTMSDPSLPLTVTEWEEWGDPRSEPYAAAIAAYSPYDNTGPADYPAIYVTAGLHDPRVGVHEPAKWVARLRAVNTGTRPVLLRTELGSGHGGPTDRYEAWRDEARTLTFLLATV